LKGYVFLDHVSDALINSYGESLEETFANAARGLIDTMIDIDTVTNKTKEKFKVIGEDLENLLYNWLETVLIKVSRDGIVFSTFDLKIRKLNHRYDLRGYGSGEQLDLRKHKPKTEVKAVTYHLMRIIKEEGKVSARFLLDL
jgi:SHS2 domain-containing protein